jgi:NAD(P)H dehydrogenase (quinone)
MKKVLVILGHPRLESYCNALSQAYERGATEAGAEVRRLDLARLEFDPILHTASEARFSGEQSKGLEPDLLKAQQDIAWADHLVFVYPSWWGSFPALFKGFIDRAFTPGFGFKYIKGKSLPEQLLKGKTARLIVTMDTPAWWNRFVYRAAGHNAMTHATLHFCGVKPVRITNIGKMRSLDEKARKGWLEKVQKLATRDSARVGQQSPSTPSIQHSS